MVVTDNMYAKAYIENLVGKSPYKIVDYLHESDVANAIVVNVPEIDDTIINIISNRAIGVVLDTSEPDEIKAAIESCKAKGYYYPEMVADIALRMKWFKTRRKATLSPRQQEVYDCILLGMTRKEIAEKLFCSPRTVDVHREKIRQKAGVRSTIELVVKKPF